MKITLEGSAKAFCRVFEKYRENIGGTPSDDKAYGFPEDVSSQTSVDVADFFEAVEAFKKLPHISRYKLSNMKISEFTDIFLPPERGDGNGENL